MGGLVKFGTGEWKIRISVADTQMYRGNSVIVTVTTTDNRAASSVVCKEGVSITYNMDANVMKQALYDNVIDWENSTLPAKDTLSIDNFTFEYYGENVLTDNINGGVKQWAPIEGGTVTLLNYPQMGAADSQQIRISFKGNADYRPSEAGESTITVNKAKVSVKVNSTNIYADEQLPANFVTTDPTDKFDIYTIYAGTTSDVTTSLYLDLPDRYTSNAILKILDPVVEAISGKTFTQMLNDGVTVGELRELFSTQELLDLLDKLNIDTGTFGQILEAVNKVPAETVLVLPNNKNIIMAAQQVDELTPKHVVVIPSKTVPQGVTAMLNFNPEGTVEENTEAMTESLGTVDTMQITYAARNSDFDGHDIHEGDYLAIYGSSLFGTSQDIKVLLRALAEKVRDSGKEFITIYYGEDIKEKHAQKTADLFSNICPNADVNLLRGGQPVYYYMISAE